MQRCFLQTTKTVLWLRGYAGWFESLVGHTCQKIHFPNVVARLLFAASVEYENYYKDIGTLKPVNNRPPVRPPIPLPPQNTTPYVTARIGEISFNILSDLKYDYRRHCHPLAAILYAVMLFFSFQFFHNDLCNYLDLLSLSAITYFIKHLCNFFIWFVLRRVHEIIYRHTAKPRWGDSNEYTQHTFHDKIRKFHGTWNEFELARVYEPSVYESLNVTVCSLGKLISYTGVPVTALLGVWELLYFVPPPSLRNRHNQNRRHFQSLVVVFSQRFPILDYFMKYSTNDVKDQSSKWLK